MNSNPASVPLRILFVEDDEHDFIAFRRAFERSQVLCEIAHYWRAEDAFERLKTDAASFDLVVSDYKLPGMPGLELFRKLLEIKLSLPMVILTGVGSERLAVEALKAGIDDYLIKDPAGGYLDLLPVVLPEVVKRYGDRSARIKAEEALFHSKQMLQLVLDTIPQRVFWKDRDSVFVGCNRSLALDCGYADPRDLIGKSDYETTSAAMADNYRADDREVMETGRAKIDYEEPQLNPDGSRKWLRTSKVPLRDRNGVVIGVLGTYEDITDRKKMEEEILKAQKLESVGLLAGGIAHDFNNILTGILGNISLAKIHGSPKDKYYARLIEAEKAAFRARELTQRLITFAKGGAPVRKTVSVAGLIKDSAHLALSGAKAVGEFDIPEDLWPVEIDEGQIGQVIHNLIVNADQAMPYGGKILVRCSNVEIGEGDPLPLKSGKYIAISIKDEGIGIPAECIGRIFDPYFTTKDQGRGLGLAAAYSIIQNHEGHISVESAAGAGSIFTIYIPVQGTGPVTEKKVSTGKGRILVMDDEEVVRQVAGEMLRCIGFDVDFAEEGSQAVELYKEAFKSGQPYIAVLMDLTIPGGMGGKETIKRLLEIDPNVKGIVSSGYSNDPVMSEFRKFGFTGVMLKPYQVSELSEQIGKILGIISE